MLDGAVTPASFTDERILDPALGTLIKKMTIQEDEEFTRKYPKEYNCRIEIKKKSGEVLSTETSFPKGHRLNALSDFEVESKFRNLASAELTDKQCGAVLETVWSLDTLTDMNQLFDCLVV